MKILVLSDSHSGLHFMRRAIYATKPDAVIHLGDYFDDGMAMAEEFPHIRFHQVPGNCDRYRSFEIRQEVLCYDVCGVRLYMTHGHLHKVKISIYPVCSSAREHGAKAVLFGHTHEPICCQEQDGLWILNPGACGSSGGSVGLIETQGNEIENCRILRQPDLEEME